MASANSRPTTSRKTPFTPPSAKPTGGRKRSAPKDSPAGVKKGNNKTTAAKRSPANGNKRKTKAETNKVKGPRARPGTAGTRKKQKVDNVVDNSEVIDVSIPDENFSKSRSDQLQLSDDPAPQPIFDAQQQVHLPTPFETSVHSSQEQLEALQQLMLFNMGPQQPMPAMMAQQRPMQSQQLQFQMPSQQHPMPLQQRPMPPQQRPVPFQQPSPKVVSQSPSSYMLPQQPAVCAQQHLSNILSQQPPMPPQQSSSDALPQHLPWNMPSQQSPTLSQSQQANVLSQEQSMHLDHCPTDLLPQQSSVHSQQDSPGLCSQQLSMSPQQDSSNTSPQQRSPSMKVQQHRSALVPQQSSPILESQRYSPDLSPQKYQYAPVASHIADKIDTDFLNVAPSTIFDQLVLTMVKRYPTLSPEHNIEAVTSAQLDERAYAIWNECLFLREGQLIVHAAQYGSMYQDVKIRALGLMNMLPGWWFLREKVKAHMSNSGKWVDDTEMESQFNLMCAKADKIIKSRKMANNEEQQEKYHGLGDLEVKKVEDLEYCDE